jgi:Uma2 family endonuclease
VEGDNTIRQAPDVMVAIGRPKKHRGSYRQWDEEGIPPQVVFEVMSPGNRAGELERKFAFYEHYGVEEYYIIDPDRNELAGFLRKDEALLETPVINGWISPRLGVRFDANGPELRILLPDGKPLVAYVDLAREAERLAAKLRAAGIDPDTN